MAIYEFYPLDRPIDKTLRGLRSENKWTMELSAVNLFFLHHLRLATAYTITRIFGEEAGGSIESKYILAFRDTVTITATSLKFFFSLTIAESVRTKIIVHYLSLSTHSLQSKNE